LSLWTTARVAPEKQLHHLPADGFLRGAMKVNMTEQNIKLNWQEAKEQGFVVADAPARKLAAFANTTGEVVIVQEDDGVQTAVGLTVKEATKLMSVLADAINEASYISMSLSVSYAVAKAKGEAV
jgi:hypothetical protein